MGSYSSSVSKSIKKTSVFSPTLQDSDGSIISGKNNFGGLTIDSGGRDSTLKVGTVNVLDGGAIENAFGFAGDALVFADKTAGGLFDLTSSIIEQNRLSTTDFYNQVKDASADALNYIADQTNTEASQRQFLLKVMAGAVAVAVLFMGFKYKWGK